MMNFAFKFAFAMTVLALPLLELALLIKLAGAFGLLVVIAIILATGAAGVWIIRTSGLSVLSRIVSNLQSGGSGVTTMLDQGLIVTAGVLLILPGVLGDLLGAVLLIPAARAPLLSALTRQFSIRTWSVRTGPRGPHPGETATPGGSLSQGPVIEGDYTRLDDDAPPPTNSQRR